MPCTKGKIKIKTSEHRKTNNMRYYPTIILSIYNNIYLLMINLLFCYSIVNEYFYKNFGYGTRYT